MGNRRNFSSGTIERTTKSAVCISGIHSSLYLFSRPILNTYLSGNKEITGNKRCASDAPNCTGVRKFQGGGDAKYES